MSEPLIRSLIVALLAGLGLSVAGQAFNGVEFAAIAGAQLVGRILHHFLLDIWHHFHPLEEI
jgi:hypothetical protein